MSLQSNCSYSHAPAIGSIPIIPSNRKLRTKQPVYDEQPLSSVPPKAGPSSVTWAHRAWVLAGCATLLLAIAKTLETSSSSWLKPATSAFAGYILSDLVSGIYHWALDNYGSPSTPIFGTQIEDFLGHHEVPWVITKYSFVNNLHLPARLFVFLVIPFTLVCNDPMILAFVTALAGSIMFSSQFHAWAHETKDKLPRAVVVLQDLGVLVSRTQHQMHHRLPHNSDYCVVSGIWNKFIHMTRIFLVMEIVIFYLFSVRPRSWDEDDVVEAEAKVE